MEMHANQRSLGLYRNQDRTRDLRTESALYWPLYQYYTYTIPGRQSSYHQRKGCALIARVPIRLLTPSSNCNSPGAPTPQPNVYPHAAQRTASTALCVPDRFGEHCIL